ncbi:MAG: internalization-related competence protein ComEC/Rec2 [Marmoricola sp.]|nr:internalization-related competence protein ComEC/Rec2 [Marmoricola sp.]
MTTLTPDLRVLALGLVAWLAALLGLLAPGRTLAGVAVVAAVVVVRRPARTTTYAGWLLVGAAVTMSAALHSARVRETPLDDLAARGATAQVHLVVDSPPVSTTGRFGPGAWFPATALEVSARGTRYRLRVPVFVVVDGKVDALRPGSHVELEGRLRPATSTQEAATLIAHPPLVVTAGPGPITSAAERVRRGIKDAAAPQAAGPRVLLPALVDGERGALPDAVVAEFRTTGMTHLLAVSGTNLTLILGSLLVLARWIGVRGRWLIVVGAFAVVGFVLLAGPQPSVLRAAAMGTVALLGLGTRGRERGVRALGVAVVGLMLADPWLATSIGFALSACATAGILLLAPGWRDALAGWLPSWVAEALAVPMAAQLACTPLVAAISGQVSLVAVAANLAAAPFVAPATVLGLSGGLIAVAAAAPGQVVAAPAGWCAAAILAIAHCAASLPVAVISWPTNWLSLVVLVVCCVLIALALRSVLARPIISMGLAGMVTVAMLVPVPVLGWPPPGWVMVVCSIGQGDGLVLNVAPHAAVVVDTGPDPAAMDDCLNRLKIRTVPVLVLTHFHADHVGGIAGVLHARSVGQIEVSPLARPAGSAAMVRRLAAAAGITVRVPVLGESTTIGPLRWQLLAPVRDSYPDSDSPPNDESLVMLVQVAGIRILMMGDEERPAQGDLHQAWPGLHADVLKVAHHGSSKQDESLIDSLGARLAVISVGMGNDYGHPAPATLDLLGRAGMTVLRTDLDGDVAVVVDTSGALRSAVRTP